jgi:hypothetical protein
MEEFKAPHHHVEYVGDTNQAVNKGDKYFVCVTKMSDGRYQIFKSLLHYKDEFTGHKCYQKKEIPNYFKFLENANQTN